MGHGVGIRLGLGLRHGSGLGNELSCGIGYAGRQTGAMASRMADRCDGEWNGVYACDGEWDGGYVAMRW